MNSKTFAISNIKFWTSFWVHMRPYLLFISGIAGMAGMAMGKPLTEINIYFVLAAIAFFLSYGFGQALTDCYQVDTDKISSPYRPLSKEIIRIRDVKLISIIGLIFCVVFLLLPNYRNIVFGILSIIGLWTYSGIKRQYWFLGPAHNAWIVALLPIMGYLVTSGAGFSGILNIELLVLVLMNFFAYANFVLIGYLKDIEADRKTGYKTFPVVHGWDKTVFLGVIISIVSAVLCAWIIDWSTYSTICFILACTLAATGHFNSIFTNKKSEENARIPIEMTVRSFLLWNLAVIFSLAPSLSLWLVAYYLIFEFVLYLRPDFNQI
ncbi:MAG: UbiA family prenyltransferase [Bacteroidia bacterium]|nr:UbiA family prenyltransferase [Bacteroidia bacterium]